MLQTNANNPKFGFLHTDDHYHEYYLKRVKVVAATLVCGTYFFLFTVDLKDFRQGTAQEEDAKKQEEAKVGRSD